MAKLPRVHFHEALRASVAALYCPPSEHARGAALLEAFSAEEAVYLHGALRETRQAAATLAAPPPPELVISSLHDTAGASLLAAAAAHVAAHGPPVAGAPLSATALPLLLTRLLSDACPVSTLDGCALLRGVEALLLTDASVIDASLVGTLHALVTDAFAWYSGSAESAEPSPTGLRLADAIRAVLVLQQLLLAVGCRHTSFVETWTKREAAHAFPVFGWLLRLLKATVAAPPAAPNNDSSSAFSPRASRPLLPLKTLLQALSSYLDVVFATTCDSVPLLPPSIAADFDVASITPAERGLPPGAAGAGVASTSTLTWRRWVAWVADCLFRSQLTPQHESGGAKHDNRRHSKSSNSSGSNGAALFHDNAGRAASPSSSDSDDSDSSSSTDSDDAAAAATIKTWDSLCTDVAAVMLACDPHLKTPYNGRVGLHDEVEAGDAAGWLGRVAAWAAGRDVPLPACPLPPPLEAASRVRHRDVVAGAATRFLRLLLRGLRLSHPLHLEAVAGALTAAHLPLLALHYLQGGDVLKHCEYRDGSAPTSGGLGGSGTALGDALEGQAMAEAEAARAAAAARATAAAEGAAAADVQISWISSKKGAVLGSEGSEAAAPAPAAADGDEGGGAASAKPAPSPRSAASASAAFVIDLGDNNGRSRRSSVSSEGSAASDDDAGAIVGDSDGSGRIRPRSRGVHGPLRRRPSVSQETSASGRAAATEEEATAAAVPATAPARSASPPVTRLRGAPLSHRFYVAAPWTWDLHTLPLPRLQLSDASDNVPPSLVLPSTARTDGSQQGTARSSVGGEGTPSTLPSLGLGTPSATRTSLPRLRRAMSDGGSGVIGAAAAGGAAGPGGAGGGSGGGLGASLQEELLFGGSSAAAAGRSPSFTARPTMDLELVPTDSSGLATDARKGGGGGVPLGAFSLGAPAVGPPASEVPAPAPVRVGPAGFPRGGRGPGARWAGTGTLTGALSIASGVEAGGTKAGATADADAEGPPPLLPSSSIRLKQQAQPTVAFACSAYLEPGPPSVVAVGAGLSLLEEQQTGGSESSTSNLRLRLPRFGVPCVPGAGAPEHAPAVDHRGETLPFGVIVSPTTGEALSYRRLRLLLELLQILYAITKTNTPRIASLVRSRGALALIALYPSVADCPPLAYWVLKLVKMQTRHLGFWKRRNMDTVTAIRRLVPTRPTDPWMEAPEALGGGASVTTLRNGGGVSGGGATNGAAAAAGSLAVASTHAGVTRLNLDGITGIGSGSSSSGTGAEEPPPPPAEGEAATADATTSATPLDTAPRSRGTPLSVAARRGRRGRGALGGGVGPTGRITLTSSSSLFNPGAAPPAAGEPSVSFTRAAFAGPKAAANTSSALVALARAPSRLRGWEGSYALHGAPLPRAAESGRPLAATPGSAPLALQEAQPEDLREAVLRYVASVAWGLAAGPDAAPSRFVLGLEGDEVEGEGVEGAFGIGAADLLALVDAWPEQSLVGL